MVRLPTRSGGNWCAGSDRQERRMKILFLAATMALTLCNVSGCASTAAYEPNQPALQIPKKLRRWRWLTAGEAKLPART